VKIWINFCEASKLLNLKVWFIISYRPTWRSFKIENCQLVSQKYNQCVLNLNTFLTWELIKETWWIICHQNAFFPLIFKIFYCLSGYLSLLNLVLFRFFNLNFGFWFWSRWLSFCLIQVRLNNRFIFLFYNLISRCLVCILLKSSIFLVLYLFRSCLNLFSWTWFGILTLDLSFNFFTRCVSFWFIQIFPRSSFLFYTTCFGFPFSFFGWVSFWFFFVPNFVFIELLGLLILYILRSTRSRFFFGLRCSLLYQFV